MSRLYDWPWVQKQTEQTLAIWNSCASTPASIGPRYSPAQRREREKAYDEALQAVELELRNAPRLRSERLATQARITAVFAHFSALALGLEDNATHILTDEFLPVGSTLARWARRFDPDLSMPDIIQACRNAWTACGMQPLLGEQVRLTSSILGYSLLYPYSDNYLDREDITREAKLHFSARFRARLRGEKLHVLESRERALWTMVELIEGHYPRADFPQVFDCLLAIHRAQEESMAQVGAGNMCPDEELLRLSCAKGGTSVLADACLARGWLTEQENQFAFEWGVLLQLGDDLQDVAEDMQRGSATLFSRAIARGIPLDALVTQLLNFSDRVGDRMDQLPHGTPTLRNLLRMSWRSLILGAVANSHIFFTQDFLNQVEQESAFGFEFLRQRRERLTSRHGLYATLFQAFLEAPEEDNNLPSPENRRLLQFEPDPEAIADIEATA